MIKLRYDKKTGKVNLVTRGDAELPAAGCEYISVEALPPDYDPATDHLYVTDGQVAAVPAEPAQGD